MNYFSPVEAHAVFGQVRILLLLQFDKEKNLSLSQVQSPRGGTSTQLDRNPSKSTRFCVGGLFCAWLSISRLFCFRPLGAVCMIFPI